LRPIAKIPMKMWIGVLTLLGCSLTATKAESCSPTAASEESCAIKANARELLFVGYALDGDETAVDEIWVRMKNQTTRYADLLEDEGCDQRESVVKVSYREVPSSSSGESGWLGDLKKNVKHQREFQIKNLNPCHRYQVKVSVDSTDLDLFEVGPFSSEEQSFAYLENSEDNEEFQRENKEAADEISISSTTDTSATLKINPSDFCARSIQVSLQPEGTAEEGCEEKTVHNEAKAASDPSEEGEISLPDNVMTFDNLQPCTKYKVMLDMFLNKREATTIASDFHLRPSVDFFYTLPASEDLKKTEFVEYDATTRNFSWNFNKFFEQTCAGSLEFTGVQVIRDEETEKYGLAGSSDVVKECDHEAKVVVLFKEGDEEKSVVVLSQTVPRSSIPPEEERVFVDENEILQVTKDECLSSPSIKLVPNDGPTPRIIAFEKPINMSEVAWEGCLDYSVEVTRSLDITHWPSLSHPGWKNLLADWSLEVDAVDDKSITFRPLEKACEVESIKLEIDCEGRVHANKKFESNRWAERLLVDEHVMSGSKYECKARLVDTEGGKEVVGPWTIGTWVNTTEEVEVDKSGQMLTASDSSGEEDIGDTMESVKKAQEGAAVAPTFIGIGCVVVIVALAVFAVWRGMTGKKAEPNPLLQDQNDLDENLSEVLVSSEEEMNIVDQREPSSGSDPIKDVSDPIKDQHGSIVGALELNAPHVDAREA